MSVYPDNFTFFGNETESSHYCPYIDEKLLVQCQSISGYYCPFVGNVSYDTAVDFYVDTPYGNIPIPLDSVNITCENQTEILSCPKGFYCPQYNDIQRCDVGYFCAAGFVKPSVCTLGSLSCPHTGMSMQSFFGLFFPFVFVLALWLYLYYTLESFVYNRREHQQDMYSNESSIKAVEELEDVQQRAASMVGEMGMFKDVERRSGIVGLGGESATDAEDALSAQSEEDLLPRKSGEFTFNKIKNPLRISFSNLKLNLKAKPDNVLLNNVFGTIKPFNITALMGPSGAGKTTLLSLLRGQAHYANCTGCISVNKIIVRSLSEYGREMAFVPQDDVVYEELSVEDNILYSAMLFNRRGHTRAQDVIHMVNKAEVMLGIDFIKHSVVGGSGVKGISGGQRKRVSIGMEMMKEAALFFLDEPTSGLDSATSISVLHCLKGLSLLGVNIVATIHQPRQEILDLLDNLILLAPGGRLAFFGSPKLLKDHFRQFGYVPSANCNIADFMMDCLAGFVVPEGKQESKPVKQIISELCDWWETNVVIPKDHRIHDEVFDSRLSAYGTETAAAEAPLSFSNGFYESLVVFMNTAYVSGSRQKKLFYRIYKVIETTSIVLLCTGLCVGYLLDPVILETPLGNPNLVQQAIVGQLVFGIFVTNTGLRLFAADELMRAREEEGGVWLLPLFVGKIGASYVEFFFYSFAFVSGYYSVLQSNSGFGNYWGLFLLLHLVFASLSNLVAIGVPGKLKDLAMLGITVVLWLFGGVQPPISQLNKKIPIVGPIFNAISPFRFSFPVQIVMELNTYSEIYEEVIDGVYDDYGYSRTGVVYNSAMLMVYGIIVNILAYLLLVTKRDNYALVRRNYGKLKDLVCGAEMSWPQKASLVPAHAHAQPGGAQTEGATMNMLHYGGSGESSGSGSDGGRLKSTELRSTIKA